MENTKKSYYEDGCRQSVFIETSKMYKYKSVKEKNSHMSDMKKKGYIYQEEKYDPLLEGTYLKCGYMNR